MSETADAYLDAPPIQPSPRDAEHAHRRDILAQIERPRFVEVPANRMKLNERLNPLEGVSRRWVDFYRDNWAETLADPLRLLVRGRTAYEIIDGRHRWLAAKELGLKTFRFGCLVHADLTEQQEAALFAYFNTMRRTVPEAEKYNVQVLHGDPLALRIQRVLDETGLRVGCYGTLRNIVERAADLDEGEAAVRFALRTLAEAFPTEPDKAFHSILVKGFGRFFLRYNTDPAFDVEGLVAKIQRGRKSAVQLRQYAQAAGSANEGAAGAVSYWLTERHDAGKRSHRLGT